MTTTEQLRARVRRAIPVPPAVARDDVGKFLGGLARVLRLRYDWPLDWDAVLGLLDDESVEFSDGQEWLVIWITEKDEENENGM